MSSSAYIGSGNFAKLFNLVGMSAGHRGGHRGSRCRAGAHRDHRRGAVVPRDCRQRINTAGPFQVWSERIHAHHVLPVALAVWLPASCKLQVALCSLFPLLLRSGEAASAIGCKRPPHLTLTQPPALSCLQAAGNGAGHGRAQDPDGVWRRGSQRPHAAACAGRDPAL